MVGSGMLTKKGLGLGHWRERRAYRWGGGGGGHGAVGIFFTK